MTDKQIPVGFGVWRGPVQHFVFLDAGQQEPLVTDVQAPGADVTVGPADPVPSGEPVIVVAPAHHRPRSRHKWSAERDIALMGAWSMSQLYGIKKRGTQAGRKKKFLGMMQRHTAVLGRLVKWKAS